MPNSLGRWSCPGPLWGQWPKSTEAWLWLYWQPSFQVSTSKAAPQMIPFTPSTCFNVPRLVSSTNLSNLESRLRMMDHVIYCLSLDLLDLDGFTQKIPWLSRIYMTFKDQQKTGFCDLSCKFLIQMNKEVLFFSLNAKVTYACLFLKMFKIQKHRGKLIWYSPVIILACISLVLFFLMHVYIYTRQYFYKTGISIPFYNLIFKS